MYKDSTIIVLGDHGSLNTDKVINLNILLRRNGYISVDNNGSITDYSAITKSCDGSAYLYLKDRNNSDLMDEVYNLIEDFNKEHNCIEHIYSNSIVSELGADSECALMMEANKGYYFLDEIEGDIIKELNLQDGRDTSNFIKAAHGYSPFKDNYTTVFMAAGKGIKKGIVIDEMNLVDEGPTMAKLLGLELENTDGRILEEFFE